MASGKATVYWWGAGEWKVFASMCQTAYAVWITDYLRRRGHDAEWIGW